MFKKYKWIIIGGAVVAGYYGYKWYTQKQEDEAIIAESKPRPMAPITTRPQPVG